MEGIDEIAKYHFHFIGGDNVDRSFKLVVEDVFRLIIRDFSGLRERR